MHPILSHFRRLLLYLAAWGPISAILLYLFVSVGGLSWGRAAAMALPLCAVYAFMCLSAWYTCRGIPLENSASWLAHLVAAGVASLLWIGSAKVLAFALSSFQTFAGLVEQIRFGSRLKLEESTDSGSLDSLLPPLLLQPLVENAVRHGVAQLTEGGWIRIEIRQPEPENLAIAIENNFDPEAPRRKGSGIGLRNVRERLDASYGSRARFDVRTNHNRFLVSLNLPAEKES